MLALQRPEKTLDFLGELRIADVEFRAQAALDLGTVVVFTQELPEPGASSVQDEDPIRFDLDQYGLLTEALSHGVCGNTEPRRATSFGYLEGRHGRSGAMR